MPSGQLVWVGVRSYVLPSWDNGLPIPSTLFGVIHLRAKEGRTCCESLLTEGKLSSLLLASLGDSHPGPLGARGGGSPRGVTKVLVQVKWRPFIELIALGVVSQEERGGCTVQNDTEWLQCPSMRPV